MPLKLLFIVMLLLGCLFGLGHYGILDNNEGMYAAIASGMLHGGSLIIPHLNGVSYLEKPPMLYWLTAASMGLFGETAWAARLPVALSTALVAIAMMLFMKSQQHRRAGFIAGIIMVSSPVILIIGRTVYCDMLLTAFMSIGLMAFYRWHQEGRRGWLVLCHSMLALAVLSKGLVAIVLMGGVALVFMLIEKDDVRRMLRAFDPLAAAAFLLIAVPWHAAAMLEEKGFTWFYFINEHLLRFIGAREPHDYYRGPVWYYPVRILLYLFPWSLLIPLLWWRAPRHPIPQLPGQISLRRFLWIWFLFIFIFFSISSAKANYYMIAGMPPLVLLMALQFDRLLHGNLVHKLWGWAAAALSLTLLVIAVLPWIGSFHAEGSSFLNNIFGAGSVQHNVQPAVVIAACGLGICWLRRRYLETTVLLMCLPAAILLPLLIGAAHVGETTISQRQAALYVQAKPPGDIAIYHDFEEISALAFYLKKPLPVIDNLSSDLAYGMHSNQRPDLFPTLSAWLQREQGHEVYLIVRNHYLSQLQHQLAKLVPQPPLCVEKQFPVVSILSRCHAPAPKGA